MNLITGTDKRDKITGTRLDDVIQVSRGKDTVRRFDAENDTLVVFGDYEVIQKGNSVVIYGDGFRTKVLGTCVDELTIEEGNPVLPLLNDNLGQL